MAAKKDTASNEQLNVSNLYV